ncbi:MAG: hypothetical protein Q9190_004095 [Brigantiaea leucoxantha]
MSSFSNIFRRSQSYSPRPNKPVRMVYNDLNSAHESITKPSTKLLTSMEPGANIQETKSDAPSSELPRATDPVHRRSVSMSVLGQASHMSIFSLDLDSVPYSITPEKGVRSDSITGLESGQLEAWEALSGNSPKYRTKFRDTSIAEASSYYEEDEHPGDENRKILESLDQWAWTPRPSSEQTSAHDSRLYKSHFMNRPPSAPLPCHPTSDQELPRDLSNSGEETIGSFNSYGNTRDLLGLPIAESSRNGLGGSSMLENLVNASGDYRNTPVRTDSSNSFAIVSFKDSDGSIRSVAVSEGDFQTLAREISNHVISPNRDVDTPNIVLAGELEISFSQNPNVEGPGSSQSSSSSSSSSQAFQRFPGLHSGPRESLRSRNGTPPLLFGATSRARVSRDLDTDWETTAESCDPSRAFTGVESLADLSDSSSQSPPISSPFPTSHVLMNTTHPRYNHSWSLHRDLRSGSLYLKPISPFATILQPPNALPTMVAQKPIKYSHPTPLRYQHSHPFESEAPQIYSSKGDQSTDQISDQAAVERSFSSGAVLSTVDELASGRSGKIGSRKGSFDRIAFLGPKENITGTPEGTGARMVGSSLADASSPYPMQTPSPNEKTHFIGKTASSLEQDVDEKLGKGHDYSYTPVDGYDHQQSHVTHRLLRKISSPWSKKHFKQIAGNDEESQVRLQDLSPTAKSVRREEVNRSASTFSIPRNLNALALTVPGSVQHETHHGHGQGKTEMLLFKCTLILGAIAATAKQEWQHQWLHNLNSRPPLMRKSTDTSTGAASAFSEGYGGFEQVEVKTSHEPEADNHVKPKSARLKNLITISSASKRRNPPSFPPKANTRDLEILDTVSGSGKLYPDDIRRLTRAQPHQHIPPPPSAPADDRTFSGLRRILPRPPVRPESPHLYSIPCEPTPAILERQKLISRLVLLFCLPLPFLLILYYAGHFDWIMTDLTKGECRCMGRGEKKAALSVATGVGCAVVIVLVVVFTRLL